jgi:hypothetical protein
MDETVETTRCPRCGFENVLDAKECAGTLPECHAQLKTDFECQRSIDVSLITIRRIAKWWLVLSIAGALFGLLWIIVAANGGKLL